jgi:hypothetical protein
MTDKKSDTSDTLEAAIERGIREADEDQATARSAAKLSKVRAGQAKQANNPMSRAVYGEKSNSRAIKSAEAGAKSMRRLADEKSSPNHRVKAK